MKVQVDCYQCLVRQIADVVKKADVSDDEKKKAILKAMKLVSESSPDETPPDIAERMYAYLHKLLNVDDAFKSDKKKMNRKALKIYPEAQNMIESSENPVHMALKIAVAGNIIDSSMKLEYEVEKLHEEAEKLEFVKSDEREFREKLSKAESLLIISDNAGEIVFDKLLVETLKRFYPDVKITVAVRGKPIINDATFEDAKEVGMLTTADEVITTGYAYPGIPLRDKDSKFVKTFLSSDVVLSKGQGNFESLSEPPREVFYLFRAKCDVVCSYLGVPKNSALFVKLGG